MSAFLFQILILPEHVIFYYKLSAGHPLAVNLPLQSQILGIYLTGTFKTVVDDPERSIQPEERQLQITAPYCARGGHPLLKTSITCLEDSTAMCIYPKDELRFLMGEEAAAKYFEAPIYSILHTSKSDR